MYVWLVVHHLIVCFTYFVTGSHFESPQTSVCFLFQLLSPCTSVFDFFTGARAKIRAEAAGVLLRTLRLQFTGNMTAHSTTLLLFSCRQYASKCNVNDQSAIFLKALFEMTSERKRAGLACCVKATVLGFLFLCSKPEVCC